MAYFKYYQVFYIASLAAIATASLPRLDEPMKGATPLYIGKKQKTVTRRVFLTHLFGYLSFMSLLVYFTGGIVKVAAPNLQPIFNCFILKSGTKLNLLIFYL